MTDPANVPYQFQPRFKQTSLERCPLERFQRMRRWNIRAAQESRRELSNGRCDEIALQQSKRGQIVADPALPHLFEYNQNMNPPQKRIKLESSSPEPAPSPSKKEDEREEDHCSICLQPIVDRAVIPDCSHEFCHECLIVWTEQSRRCPLCSQAIGSYVIHHIRSKYDFTRHYLAPLRTSPRHLQPLSVSRSTINRRPTRREREWGRRERQEREEADQLERSILKRKWIYRHNLYAKHAGSNTYSRYRPFPTPVQFAASSDYMSRTTTFVRRELQVWPNLDVEFLTTFIISLMKSIDIRSESAIKLLSEFLDMDEPYMEGVRQPNAEHFAHEIYTFLRSPFRDLYVYDSIVQYDSPSYLESPLPEFERERRWRVRSQSPSHSRSSKRSPSPRVHRSSSHYASRELPVTSRSRKHSLSRSPSRLHSRSRHNSIRRNDRVDTTRRGSSPLPKHESSDRDAAQTRSDKSEKGKSKARDLSLDLNDNTYQSDTLKDNDKAEIKLPSASMPVVAQVQLKVIADAQNNTKNDELKPKAERDRGRVKGGRAPTLLESVHSHLSLNGKSKSRAPDSINKEGQQVRTPSLLCRLSDPQTKDGPPDESNHPADTSKLLLSSTSDVMERTRARLAKLKNESIAGVSPFAPTPCTSSSVLNSPGALRDKLLDKLQAEKRLAGDGVSAPSKAATEVPPYAAVQDESVRAESVLRVQAQLSVRLAAEKRAQESKHQGSSIDRDVRREEALKERLMGSRHTSGSM